MQITDLNAGELSVAIHQRQVSCRQVMQAYLDRIAALNSTYNAIVSLQPADTLLAQADERDAQLARGEDLGWLHGIPQAIKDLTATAGIRTTQGSPLLRESVPAQDALLVARMRAAGAIIIGKTNTPEFGLGSHTFNEVFGATRNPYDLTRTPGGSSGGAAVSLATRMLPVADGSDFMGSLRNPAGWNNVFGFRPSQGRVPSPETEDAWVTQLSTGGPMGRTVADVARLLHIQAGYHPAAPLSLADEQFDGPLGGLDLRRVRIGWLGDLDGYLAMEPGILDACAAGLRRLAAAGATVEPLALGFPPERVWDAWLVWRRWLAGNRIVGFLQADPANRARIKPEALWEYDQAQGLTGLDVMRASTERTAFYRHLLTLFEGYDYLVLPSAQVWPFDLTLRCPASIHGRAMDTYHRWMEVTIYATFAGLPALAVPVGFNAAGLPMGMQVLGRPRADLDVLRLGHAYEQLATDVLAVRPPTPA